MECACRTLTDERQEKGMGKILSKLYAGEVHPADSVIRGCREYEAMCSKSLREMECFTKKLDKDMKAEFETLMEHYLELTYMEKSHTFSQGFRLGAGIMWEVFCEGGQEQM